MDRADLCRQLCLLRPEITNIIGFYDLLYEQSRELTPFQRMTFEAHFATSSHKLAFDVMHIVNRLLAEPD